MDELVNWRVGGWRSDLRTATAVVKNCFKLAMAHNYLLGKVCDKWTAHYTPNHITPYFGNGSYAIPPQRVFIKLYHGIVSKAVKLANTLFSLYKYHNKVKCC